MFYYMIYYSVTRSSSDTCRVEYGNLNSQFTVNNAAPYVVTGTDIVTTCSRGRLTTLHHTIPHNTSHYLINTSYYTT